jgi:hypothetical protein
LEYMTDLVTITCNIERHLMVLQAESVLNFMEPCTHWVIVNEKNVDVHAWHDILKPYYKHHTLYVIPRRFLLDDERMDELSGHATQQVLKMLVSRLVQKDYLLLDAKNFFVQPFKLSTYDDFIGSGYLEQLVTDDEEIEEESFFVSPLHSKYWQGTIDVYMARLGMKEMPKYFLGPRTPFKVDYKLLNERIDLDKFFTELLYWDVDKNIANPSEFLFYSLAVNDLIKPGVNTMLRDQPRISHTYFFENFHEDAPLIANAAAFEDPGSIINTDEISVFGFHRKFLELCGPEHIMQINRYLMNKGFKFRFM